MDANLGKTHFRTLKIDVSQSRFERKNDVSPGSIWSRFQLANVRWGILRVFAIYEQS